MSINNDTLISKDSSIVETITLINIQFVRKLPLIFTIIGTIGFIGNIFTFLQPNLRKNTFCLYSLFVSICDMLNIYINLLPNYIYDTDNIVQIIVGVTSCRWKLFGLVTIPQMSINFLILSLIDRYSSTCSLTSPLRKMRKLKTVPYFTFFTIIVSIVMSLYGSLLYGYVPGLGCVPTDTLINGISYLSIQGLLTLLVMFIFTCLTFRNVKRSRQRVGTVQGTSHNRSRFQFIGMAFAQVFVTSFFLLQWMSFYLYHIATIYRNRSIDELIVHYFVFGLSNVLFYINNIKSFYLSTLTSRLFRKTLKKRILMTIGEATGKQMVVAGMRTMPANTALG